MSDSDSEIEEKVFVYLYDISMGMARTMSMPLLGQQIDGVWHTGIVVYGYEYFYGGGIQAMKPGTTVAGQPLKKIEIGVSSIPQDLFHDFLRSIGHRFTPATYSLLSHNCNNFTNECSRFLTGKDIPDYITGLPEMALNTPMGQMFKPIIQNMEQQMKQQVGKGGMGAVPWVEEGEGGASLFLPPIEKKAKPQRKKKAKEAKKDDKKDAGAATGAAGGDAKGVSNQDSVALAAFLAAAAAAGSGGELKGVPPSGSASVTPVTPMKSSADLKAGQNAHLTLKLSFIKPDNKAITYKENRYQSLLSLLSQYSKKIGEKALTPAEFASLRALCDSEQSSLTVETATLLARLLIDWSVDSLYPLLAIYSGLTLRSNAAASIAQSFGSFRGEQHPIGKMIQYLSLASKPIIHTYNLRLVINLLSCNPSLASKLAQESTGLVRAVLSLLHLEDSSRRKLASDLLFNASLVLPKDDSDFIMEIVTQLVEAIKVEKDGLTCLSLLRTLGQMCFRNSTCSSIVSSSDIDTKSLISRFSSGSADLQKQLNDICSDIGALTRE